MNAFYFPFFVCLNYISASLPTTPFVLIFWNSNEKYFYTEQFMMSKVLITRVISEKMCKFKIDLLL